MNLVNRIRKLSSDSRQQNEIYKFAVNFAIEAIENGYRVNKLKQMIGVEDHSAPTSKLEQLWQTLNAVRMLKHIDEETMNYIIETLNNTKP